MMMHGTVMKITEHKIIVLCEDGKFLNLPHPPVMPQLGERIAIPPQISADRPQKRWYKHKSWAIAASFLLLIGLAFVLKSWQGMAKPIAFIAIDINPGIELYLSKQGHIKQVHFMNEDARQLMSEGDLLGLEFYEGTQLIWAKAEEYGYLDLNSNKKWIWVSVVDLGNSSFSVNPEKMGAADKGYEVELFTTSRQQLEQAHDSGLSLNKYIVYEQAKEKGIDLSLEELREQSIITSLQKAGVAPEQLFVSEQSETGQTDDDRNDSVTQDSEKHAPQQEEKHTPSPGELAQDTEPTSTPTLTPMPTPTSTPMPTQKSEREPIHTMKPEPTPSDPNLSKQEKQDESDRNKGKSEERLKEGQSLDRNEESKIVKLKLEVEKDRDDEFKLSYKNKNGKVQAKVEEKSNKGEDLQEGEQAISLAELLIHQLALKEQVNQADVLNQILYVLNINQDEWKEIELEIEFSSGTELEFKYKKDSKDKKSKKKDRSNGKKEHSDPALQGRE